MNLKHRMTRITAAILASIGGCAAANADTIERTTRSTDGDGLTTTTRTVTTSSTNPISSDSLASVLNARRYQLDKLIGDGMMRNAISSDLAPGLQEKLSRVTADWMAARSTGQPITMDQAVSIARELDALNNDVAGALGVSPLSRLTVGADTSGTARIVVDQFGNVIGLKSASPYIYIGTLDARRLQLENSISIGLASGSLRQEQASDLRAELERVARDQAEGGVDSFTYVNALPLAMSLDSVGSQLQTVLRTESFAPLINGNRFIVSGGAVIMLDDIMVRRAELESRISHELARGRISSAQTDTLREQMRRVGDMEADMRTKGDLNFRDSRTLYSEFDKVGSRLDGYIAEGKSTPIGSSY